MKGICVILWIHNLQQLSWIPEELDEHHTVGGVQCQANAGGSDGQHSGATLPKHARHVHHYREIDGGNARPDLIGSGCSEVCGAVVAFGHRFECA